MQTASTGMGAGGASRARRKRRLPLARMLGWWQRRPHAARKAGRGARTPSRRDGDEEMEVKGNLDIFHALTHLADPENR